VELHLEVSPAGDAFLAASGEVGGDGWIAFRQAIFDAGNQTRTTVILDLSGVTFFDSSAIRAVIGAKRVLGEQGVTLIIGPTSPIVERVLEITGLRPHLGDGQIPA
jgi:anti-anti-sigma factor